MVIQSLSVAVPAPCPNACGFCVSRMHSEDYPDQIEKNKRFRDLYKRDYADRLAFARDNGCNSLIYTGSGEPLCNQRFMEEVADMNQALDKPFRILELQTSGVGLDEEALRWLRNTVRVSVVSLSLSSVWSSGKNREYNATPEKLAVDIDGLCRLVKGYDFTLRLSLNMTDEYDDREPAEAFARAADLGADQLTFRKLYRSGKDTGQDEWIARHGMREDRWALIDAFIRQRGRRLERLPFGAWRYSVGGISTVVDDDCMSTATDKDEIKYLILRPDCKLYTKWDDTGSLLF